jgi:hypothetical protein
MDIRSFPWIFGEVWERRRGSVKARVGIASTVIPAKAGIQAGMKSRAKQLGVGGDHSGDPWIPAFAGMTTGSRIVRRP